jgi:hypothetical protein
MAQFFRVYGLINKVRSAGLKSLFHFFTSFEAVNIKTGTWLPPGSFFIRVQASNPPMTGIMMSSKTRSGRDEMNSSSASFAVFSFKHFKTDPRKYITNHMSCGTVIVCYNNYRHVESLQA